MTATRRLLSVLFSLVVAGMAAVLAANVLLADGTQWVDFVRIGLLSLSAAWLAWGATIALNGILSLPYRKPAQADPQELTERTAVLIPVYNEDPRDTFSRIAAMMLGIDRTGKGDLFDFVILSDTTRDEIAEREHYWLARLRAEPGIRADQVFYRRREQNTGKKAGNIADFIRTSGARYEFMIILDADSLMVGETMLTMALRMKAAPRLGLLQTLPKIIAARSWFGRAVQFAASYYSPAFARGVAETQGHEGPFWGHNAIVRTVAFAESCGLPALSGKPPFGGHILSHDYVEAALLARAGWIVRLDPDLEGSFEEGPENIVDYAKRDRRWCQGNLQHGRLVAAPGLKPWSRFVFVQGIMAYVSSPIWALFLLATVLAPFFIGEPNYFPEPARPPVFPQVEHVQALVLLTGVLGILIGPKLLIVLRNILTRGNRGFGGDLTAFAAVVTEIAWSSILAPLMLMYQTRSVLQVLLGADGGWPASNRKGGTVGLREAWDASWWIVVTGVILFALGWWIVPDLFFWLMPVAIPMIISPLIIHFSSRPFLLRNDEALFTTPQEQQPETVILARAGILARWEEEPEFVPQDELSQLILRKGGTQPAQQAFAR